VPYSFSIWYRITVPVPSVSWCRAMIGSIRCSHSSLAAWKSAALLRALPFCVVSQPGKPPESVSALMYGPGRAIT
jgi:hypothetical protein